MNRGKDLTDDHGVSITLSIPAPDQDLFKHKATNEVLLFLTNHRFEDFSLREVSNQVDLPLQSVRRAVDVLVANGLLVESPEGNRRLVQIDRDRLSVPDDPILRIPQAEFQAPVKEAVDELVDRIEDVVGVVLYGSVARGDADRRSDVDLWVLTRSERADGQRRANAVARDLEERTFDGERYAYDVDVESVRAVPNYTESIREIIVSGIPVYETGDFGTVKSLLLDAGDADE